MEEHASGLGEGADSVSEHLDCPSDKIGKVIGRQGATIKELQAKTMTRIQVGRGPFFQGFVHVFPQGFPQGFFQGFPQFFFRVFPRDFPDFFQGFPQGFLLLAIVRGSGGLIALLPPHVYGHQTRTHTISTFPYFHLQF